MRARNLGPLTLVLGLAAGAAAASTGEVSVRAYVEPHGPHAADRPLVLVIEASGDAVPDLSVHELPPMENLRVIAGPSQGTFREFRFDASGAHQLVRRTLRYTLSPLGPGPARIPSVAVRVGQATFRTAPIELEIGGAGPRPGASPPAPAVPRRGPGPRQGDEAAVWLEARADTDTPWQGQAVTLELVLYAGPRVSGVQLVSAPELDDFWAEALEVDPAREAYAAEYGGRSVTAYPVLRYLLVPNRTGRITIAPFVLQVEVEEPGGDRWRNFFFLGRSRRVLRQSAPLQLDVRALPREGRPADFSGAVGSFRVRAELDRERCRVHDALALRLRVEGDGFLETARPPALELGRDFRVFEPRVEQRRRVRGGRLEASKVWEWVVVPLVPGEREMPPLRFSFFDPAAGTYRTVESQPGTLLVEALPAAEAPAGESALAQARREILFIKPLEGRLQRRGDRVYRRPWFLALALLPVAWVPCAVWLARRRAARAGVRHTRRAHRRARRQLRALERRAPRLEPRAFYTSLNRLLMDYVAARLGRPAAGLTYEAADRGLAAQGVSEDARRRWRLLLERCDFARYVPEERSATKPADALGEARRVLDELERTAP